MRREIKGGKGKNDVMERDDPPDENHSGIVQCKGYRCWAMKGQDAKWRDVQGTVLEVLEVVAEF